MSIAGTIPVAYNGKKDLPASVIPIVEWSELA